MRQPNLGQACLKPFRRVNCCPVIQSKEMFQTEVHPDRFTCSWKNVVTFLLDDDKQKVFALSGSFDCNSFDSSINGAGFPEFIFSPTDDDHIAVRLKRIASLLESETLVLGTLLKSGRRFASTAVLLDVLEKRIIGATDALDHVLNSLRAEFVPVLPFPTFLKFCDVLFQLIHRKSFAINFIVHPAHGNTEVPNLGGNFNLLIQVFVFLAIV